MRDAYPKADDAPPVPLALEIFGEGPEFGVPGIGIGPASGDSRLRLRSGDGSRMVQVQNGWLLANWMKRPDSAYPGYSGVLEQFSIAYTKFTEFLNSEALPAMSPDVWEVTYIDHIPRGTVWQDWSDIPRVIPGLLGHCSSCGGRFHSFGGNWGFGLVENRGRLQISLQTARTVADLPTDILVVRSTARGPVVDGSIFDLLNHGRAAVVDTFMDVVSDSAKTYWKG
jgi:uncharacterized protein (TIGR04255 family)